ncbi:MAG: DUF1858 domain-containing protein [Candidatus Margulisbacteria bacterium]|nr:DUF1858 domain-containing protein [Candidatus Margulisiibacteriota bacterium]
MITKEMNIAEVLGKYPEALEILQKKGIGCVGCMLAHAETLAQGLESHGFNADEVIAEMNTIIKKK